MTNKKYKILHVTRNLPPLIGGMEKLNLEIANRLAKHYELTCIGPKLAKASISTGIKFYGVPHKNLFLFVISSCLYTLFASLKHRPNIIISGSGLASLPCFVVSKLTGAKSIVYLHGLDIAVNHWAYETFWISSIKKCDRIIANSEYTKNMAISRGIPEHKIEILQPGVTIPTERNERQIDDFKNKYGLDNREVIISVGRITERKGLREFVDLCLPKIKTMIPDILVLVIGSEARESLYAKSQSIATIKQNAEQKNLANNILFIGPVTDQEILSTAYYSSKAHIFPVKELKGDPEGFGMVAIEAAAHGIATIAFRTGGTNESVKSNQSGYLLEPKDYEGFCEAVIETVKNSRIDRDRCKAYSRSFCWDNFESKLLKIIQHEIG